MRISSVLSVGGGVIGGAVAAVVASRVLASGEPVAASAGSRVSSVRDASHSLADGSPTPAHEPKSVLSPEGRRRLLSDAFSAALKRHSEEAIDVQWSSQAAAGLRDGIIQVGDGLHGGVLRDIDCRMTTCVARLQWPSFEDAQRTVKPLVEARFTQENCGARLLLSPPDDPSKPYEASMFFDCADAQNGLAEEHVIDHGR